MSSFVPLVFLRGSQSKLRGYTLPAVPAGALLVGEYLAGRRSEARNSEDKKFSVLFAAAHGILCGALIFAALSAASVAITHHLRWERGTYVALAVAGVFALGIAAALLFRNGLRLLRPLTMAAVVLSVGAVIRFAAPVIDATQSARPIAESIQAFSHDPAPIDLYHVNGVQQYRLGFYFNRPTHEYGDVYLPAPP